MGLANFCDFDGWGLIVLFFIFLAFQDCIENISLKDWIPFLVLLLICCSYCNGEYENCNC